MCEQLAQSHYVTVKQQKVDTATSLLREYESFHQLAVATLRRILDSYKRHSYAIGTAVLGFQTNYRTWHRWHAYQGVT